MARFEPAVEAVLDHEGGGRFVDHPSDPGGATRWGISLRYLRTRGAAGDVDGNGQVGAEDIRRLTRDQAVAIYREDWWLPGRYAEIQDQLVAEKVFSLAVNMGDVRRRNAPNPAHTLLQRAVRAASGIRLEVDGRIGDRTLAAVNACQPAALLAALRSEAAGRYRRLVLRNDRLGVLLQGWLNRAYA